MMISKQKTQQLVNEYSQKLGLPVVTENKYTGIYSFPVTYQTICDKEGGTILQKYSSNSCLKVSSGKVSTLLLTNVGGINFTEKVLYGFYSFCLFEHYEYYIKVRSLNKLVDKIIEDSYVKPMMLIMSDGSVIKTPTTELNSKMIHYEFYTSFFFWFVTLQSR